MKRIILALLTMAAFLPGASPKRTFTGVITDSMCGRDHRMMKITPDSKCTKECVKSSADVKFALFDGKNVYKLSDQQTPQQFAGQKVKVTGTLFHRTGILQVEKIEVLK